jgi:hypothetical protein
MPVFELNLNSEGGCRDVCIPGTCFYILDFDLGSGAKDDFALDKAGLALEEG